MSIDPQSMSSSSHPLRERNWLSRNWWWLVLVVLFFGLFLCAGCCGGVYALVAGISRNSPVYEQALQRIRENQEIVAHTGEPLEAHYFPFSSNVHVEPNAGDAQFTFAMSGPKGKINVHFEATYEQGRWHYHVFDVTLPPGGKVIDLSDPGP